VTKLDNLTDEQKQHEIHAFRERQRIMISRGKVIVIAIAIFSMLGAVYNVVTNYNVGVIIGAVFSICCSVALIKGVPWVRYFFIVSFILSAFIVFLALDMVSPPRSFSEISGQTVAAIFDSATGETTFTVVNETTFPREELEGVTAIYVWLSVLLAVYIICANILMFSKSVKEYLYAERYQ